MTRFFHSGFAKASRFHWDFVKDIQDIERWDRLAKAYTFWKGREISEASEYRAPKIIHQIWLGPKPLPDLYKRWGKTWEQFNPGFEYRLWMDKDIESLGLENQEIFNRSDNYGVKSDLARYEILYRFGGIYVDTDFECVAPIPTEILSFSFVGCIQFNASPELGNSVLVASPQDPLLGSVIKSCTLPDDSSNMLDVLNATGPYLLTRKYFEADSKTLSNTLVLPSDYFFPWPNFAMSFEGNPHSFVTANSIGIHHWQTSWSERPRQGIRYYLRGLAKAALQGIGVT